MRILELIPNLASGGAERFVTDLSNELVLDGNDVSIFTFRSAHNLNFYKDELLPQVCLKEYPGSWTLISKLIQFLSYYLMSANLNLRLFIVILWLSRMLYLFLFL